MQTHLPNHIIGKDEAIERVGDADIYREIAHLFSENLTNYMAQLDSAMSEKDYPTVKRLTHSIKSNCATVGADGLRAFFASMEQAADENLEAELTTLLPQALTLLSELRQNLASL